MLEPERRLSRNERLNIDSRELAMTVTVSKKSRIIWENNYCVFSKKYVRGNGIKNGYVELGWLFCLRR